MAPVRAGLHRLAYGKAGLLSLTALGLFPLYVSSNSALAALGVAVSLVPGCLLTSCECSRLAELKRRALSRLLTQPWLSRRLRAAERAYQRPSPAYS